MPDSFVNTTHHDEHWHHGGSQIQENENALHFLTGELKEEYTFTFPGLEKFKIREEKTVCLSGKVVPHILLITWVLTFLRTSGTK
jgi:hypothetical protein